MQTSSNGKEQQVKEEVVKKPGKDDVHEQREENQPKEGVVTPGTKIDPKNNPPSGAV